MRASPIYRGEYNYEATPEVVIGRLVGIDVSSGIANYKVIDDYGNTYKNCLMINNSGNNAGFTHTPLAIGQSVMLLSVTRNQPPYILGSIYKPAGIPINVNNEIASTSDNDTLNQNDYMLTNGGHIVNLSQKNGVTISSNDVLRLQLKQAASVLRISAEGLVNDDNPLNGQEFIDALFAYLDALEVKVNANSDFVSFSAPAVAGSFNAMALAAGEAPDPQNPGEFLGLNGLAAKEVGDVAETAATPLTSTSAQTKTTCEAAKNTKIILPQD